MRVETVEVPGTPHLAVRLTAGSLALREGPPGAVRLTAEGSAADRLRVEVDGHRVTVAEGRRGRHRMVAEVPPGTSATVRATSADLVVEVPLGSLEVAGASGDVTVGPPVAGDVRITAGSADVELGDVGGDLVVRTASGDLTAGRVGGATRVVVTSGDATVADARGAVEVRSASGDIRVRRSAGPRVSVTTVSGDVVVGFPPGMALDLDLQSLAGRVRHAFDADAPAGPADAGDGPPAEARVEVRTVSGDVELRSA